MGKRDDGSDGRTKDQSENGALYKSIKQAMDTRHPVGVVVGKEYPFMPVRMDKEFSVLGWFQVTHIWPEREIDTGFIYYAYRLEYIGQEPKWWLAQPITPQDASPNPDFLCSECGKTSPQVFSNGPTCLTRECTRFYVFESENPVGEPRYSEKFLAGGKVHVDGMVDPGPIFPPIPARIEGKIGAACPVCRCASRRRHFTLLECEACGWTLGVDLPAYTIERLALDEANFAKSKHEATHERVAMRTLSIPGWNVTEWLFKDSSGAIVGSVSHFVATSQSGKEDANSLLAEIQATPLDLRRNAVRNPGTSIEVLTAHFAKNFGARYKFAVTVESTGFDEAPDIILKAVQRLSWFGRQAVKNAAAVMETVPAEERILPTEFVPFNECLALGYFSDSMISFHDDGEKELGHTVATLSLGAPSVMSFRPKKRSGLKMFGRQGGKDGTYPAIIKFACRHGDYVVMHGRGIHALYEHEVVPKGGRRYALTCRSILPESIEDPEERALSLARGTLPDRAKHFEFHG